MDLSAINKVANRKRASSDAEQLREKMSRESSKIIKLRVAQDTAFWELKERLSGVEGEHERLQQNMLNVQMQHEQLSARYQDELRLRPETLNKVAGARDLCDALEQHAERVRDALNRAAADRAALASCYAGAARRVHDAHAQHARAADAARARAEAAADRARSGLERSAEVAAREQEARRDADATRGLLRAATDRADRLQAHADHLQQRLVALQADLHRRELAIDGMQLEAERRATAAAAEAERAAVLRDDLQERARAAAEALQEARASLAAAEARGAALAAEVGRRTEAEQELEAIRADLERGAAAAEAANEKLRNEIREIERKAEEESSRARAARSDAETALAALRDEREARAADAAAAGEGRAALERSLEERAGAVARLMRDVAAEAEARARADSALQAAADRTRALHDAMQTKERELQGQARTVLELTTEKERLQDVIRGMQDTIDNIQKELTRKASSPATATASAAVAASARREPPQHDDDNALPSPPHPPCPPRQEAAAATAVFHAPKSRAVDDLLYHFLSDSSMDADALDPGEVNARFEALSRGVVPPPTSLQALKRRPRAAAAAPGCGSGAAEDALSLSQVRSELATRGRTFFRNKRIDAKPRKYK